MLSNNFHPSSINDLLRMASMFLEFLDTHRGLVELVVQDQVESQSS
jgi:hypothetical protein